MNFVIARKKMVRDQIESPLSPDREKVSDRAVIDAMLSIPRHIFVEEALAMQAYSDTSLPIGEKQTISQPYMVAKMTELLQLKKSDKVLEIGTGSGYQTAVLATIADRVCSMERIRPLALKARKCLDSLKLFNVVLKINDSKESAVGWDEESPFDAIIVTAGAPDIPEELIAQLAVDGRLVIPVGSESEQQLIKIVKKNDGVLEKTVSTQCRFVPLLGISGWKL